MITTLDKFSKSHYFHMQLHFGTLDVDLGEEASEFC